ncbi:hypothetical protein K504DRAFT_498781 [Pleomassaria siparia CBS 279.74]|uniref:Uncharacterized protein n=1 Tax=Pleomassaria siparia CBS 279.74 TaxID=1314801 RepID=A0A6G1KN65_9PLEO|nr:hypothetical protein K504DRAFT_498781 [Pleomassaria siparia CBS 279.74]
MQIQNLLLTVTAFTLIAFAIAAPIPDNTEASVATIYEKSCGPEPVGTINARGTHAMEAACGH